MPTLSTLAIDNLQPKEGRRYDVADSKAPGLFLTVLPSGVKVFTVRFTAAGRRKRLTLGKHPTLTIDKARKLAGAALVKVAAGSDPQDEKVVARRKAAAGLDKEDTLGSAYDRYLKWAKTERKMRPKSVANIESAFKLVFTPKFGRRPLREIESAEVLRAIDKAGDKAHTYAVGKAFFNWARAKLLIDKSPMDGLEHPAKGKPQRDRVLNTVEIQWLWKAADEMAYPFGPMIKLLLLTGARRDEVAKMTRAELDLENRIWTLPAARSKNKREHVVHLSDAAVDVLKSLKKVEGKPGYCFTTTGDSPVSGYSRAKDIFDRKMAKYAGDETIPDWTFHDLRRTTATGMGELGIPVVVIEAALNHVSGVRGGLVGKYQHQTYAAERRDAFQKWGEHVSAVVAAAPGLVPSQDEAALLVPA